MTDTTISDAVVFPEDDGTGVADGSEDYASAGYLGLLAQAVSGTYVGAGLGFATVDTTNETVDIGAGHAFIDVSGVSVQSGAQQGYDTTLPDPMTAVVVLPSDVAGLGLDTDTENDIWVAFDPTTNDGVYIRHGSGLSAPTDPSIKLGTVDTSTGATTRANDTVTPSQIDVTGLPGDLADAQDPKGHASSHSAGSADEMSVENLGTAGASGTVPTSQGDGSLAMEAIQTGVDAEDNGSVVVSGATALSFGTDLSVSSDGDGTATVDASGGVSDPGNVLGGSSSDNSSTAVHPNASTSDSTSVAVGYQASTTLNTETAVGNNATTDGGSSMALGANSSATADSATALGLRAEATNANEGVLGGSGSLSTNSWVVPGDFTVNGSKNFEIDHPAQSHTHDLRHGNYEGDVAGGLIYRRTVTVSVAADDSEGTATITMPDWFGPLATDVDVVVQADGHFGDAYAERTEPNGENITVHANASGDYTCIIFATRDDENVSDPADHDVVRAKGVGWDGSPRAYYRDAPAVNPSDYTNVERVEQFFDHDESDDTVPCASAFVEWRVTFTDGERVDVDEPMDATGQTVVDAAKTQRGA